MACTVLATVIGVYPERGSALCDAGSRALGKVERKQKLPLFFVKVALFQKGRFGASVSFPLGRSVGS